MRNRQQGARQTTNHTVAERGRPPAHSRCVGRALMPALAPRLTPTVDGRGARRLASGGTDCLGGVPLCRRWRLCWSHESQRGWGPHGSRWSLACAGPARPALACPPIQRRCAPCKGQGLTLAGPNAAVMLLCTSADVHSSITLQLEPRRVRRVVVARTGPEKGGLKMHFSYLARMISVVCDRHCKIGEKRSHE